MHEPSGLRFDVYERVHLPEEAADIREIEEVELTPFVQAERQGDQVVLRGSLLLGGIYLPDDESRNSRQLEHWIPVEITLPLERVGRLEDLAVEVDNFDVDLLDKRTLNITGVLMLQGVKAGTEGSRQQSYAWGEEPYTVVHRRGRDLIEDGASDTAGESAQQDEASAQAFAQDGNAAWEEPETAQTQAHEPEQTPAAAEWRAAGEPAADAADDQAGATAAFGAEAAAESPDGSAGQTQLEREPVQAAGPLEWQAFAARELEEQAAKADAVRQEAEPAADADAARHEADGAASGSEPDSGKPSDAADSYDAAVWFGADSAQEEAELSQPQEALAAAGAGSGAQAAFGKADLKVAFGAKRESDSSGSESSPGLGKLFFPDRREARSEAAEKAQSPEAFESPQTREAADTADAAEYRQSASSDEVDWRSLFRGAAAQESFRTVRLCIVQKDDTLESIAIRYQRNPREIALANRLDGSPVTEGQVLYIP